MSRIALALIFASACAPASSSTATSAVPLAAHFSDTTSRDAGSAAASPLLPPVAPAAVDPAAAADLQWIVTSQGEDPHADIPATKWRLTLRIGGEKSLALGVATGSLMPDYQNICHPALRNDARVYPVGPKEVAKLSLMYAGADIYAVRHSQGDHYEVVHFVDGHEECPAAQCPLPGEVVARFRHALPAAPRESITVIDAGGNATPFQCAP